MMSKKTWIKWGVFGVGSTLLALDVGACIADALLRWVILRIVA